MSDNLITITIGVSEGMSGNNRAYKVEKDDLVNINWSKLVQDIYDSIEKAKNF